MEEKVTKCSVSKENAEAASIRVFLIKNSLPPSRKDEEASWKVCKCKTNHWNG